MKATNIFWLNKTNLSEQAIQALKEKYGEIELIQLSELIGEFLPACALFNADIVAFQKGSLPPDLQDEIMKRRCIVHGVDSNFNFVCWEEA